MFGRNLLFILMGLIGLFTAGCMKANRSRPANEASASNESTGPTAGIVVSNSSYGDDPGYLTMIRSLQEIGPNQLRAYVGPTADGVEEPKNPIKRPASASLEDETPPHECVDGCNYLYVRQKAETSDEMPSYVGFVYRRLPNRENNISIVEDQNITYEKIPGLEMRPVYSMESLKTRFPLDTIQEHVAKLDQEKRITETTVAATIADPCAEIRCDRADGRHD